MQAASLKSSETDLELGFGLTCWCGLLFKVVFSPKVECVKLALTPNVISGPTRKFSLLCVFTVLVGAEVR